MILMKTMMEISQESRWQKSGYYLEILHSHLGGWIYLLLMSFLIRKLGSSQMHDLLEMMMMISSQMIMVMIMMISENDDDDDDDDDIRPVPR